MKKLAVLVAIISVAAFAAPALSQTNPFMDVPMNHWAYDAIGQLAAHGILSGYPDGLYKGQQPTTRYEMASALARALAVVDMTKASKQDVEMLKRLVVEFKDELEALGVRVDELDERVAIFEDRLGGWHIHGQMELDVQNKSENNALKGDGDGSIAFDNARIFFERTWGEDDEYHFLTRFGGASGTWEVDRFFVEMPFFFDSRLTVGRFLWDWEGAYRVGGSEADSNVTGGWLGDSVLTDWTWNGFGLTKNFGLGSVNAVFAHPDRWFENWMIMLNGSFQFTEQIGFDIGGQVFVGDNAETTVTDNNGVLADGNISFNNLWTIYAGLRFNFNDDIAFKGIFYHQEIDRERLETRDGNRGWFDFGYGRDANGGVIDDANHWAVMLDVKQAALRYTSVWLEYGQFDQGFAEIEGTDAIFPSQSAVLTDRFMSGRMVGYDMAYWRVVLSQRWTDQWATSLFYYGYNVEDAIVNANGTRDDANPAEYGVGIQYKLNDYTTMGLNYIHVDNDLEGDDTEDNVIRFRTKVVF